MLINLTDRSDLNLKDVAVDVCDRRLAFMGTIPYPMRTNPVGGSGLLKSEPILVFQKPPIDCERIHRTIRIFGGAAAPGAAPRGRVPLARQRFDFIQKIKEAPWQIEPHLFEFL
jgi:hypothetical protein